ncbi:MAG: cytochrome PufQ [Alphaproteobacteria bacterium]
MTIMQHEDQPVLRRRQSHQDRIEYSLYFSLIFVFIVPFMIVGWILQWMQPSADRMRDPMSAAWQRAGAITPMIFKG